MFTKKFLVGVCFLIALVNLFAGVKDVALFAVAYGIIVILFTKDRHAD